MNKIKFFFLLISILFISCEFFFTSDVSEKCEDRAILCISTDLLNSRTVLPIGINENMFDFSWKLVGSCGNTTFEKVWEDDIASGKTSYQLMISDNSILLDIGSWNFELTTYNKDNLIVLTSNLSCDLISGSNFLQFNMQEPIGEPGYVYFKLNFPSNVIKRCVAKLYDLNTNVIVSNSEKVINADNSSFLSSIVYDLDGNSIDSGYYYLIVDLQQEINNDIYSDFITINTYTCLIRVSPGLYSRGEYELPNLATLYKIDYEINGGTFTDTTITTSYNQYTSFTLPIPIKNGYDFKGWYTDSSFNHSITKVETGSVGNITLYAKWVEKINYVQGLMFDSANNTFYISDESGLITFGNIISGRLTDSVIVQGYNSSSDKSFDVGSVYNSLNAELTQDIVLTKDWEPMGTEDCPFTGLFNGNNKKISNFSIKMEKPSLGFFGYTDYQEQNCEIKNLILEGIIAVGADNTGYNTYSGGFVGYARNTKFINCVNKVQIKDTTTWGYSYYGGFVGVIEECIFNNCVNFASVSALEKCGGFVGNQINNTNSQFYKCINLGDVNDAEYSAGIIANNSGSLIINDCLNLGTIISTKSSSGIGGYSSIFEVSISNCINSGVLESPFMYAIQQYSDKGTYIDCYHNINVLEDTPQDVNSTCSKTETSVLVSGSMIYQTYANWSFEAGRYPLPNIQNDIPIDIWNEVVQRATP